jgi:two-component system sensor histidine kinase CiaH
MPDGAIDAEGSSSTPAEAALLRRVRLNLALWSGGITLAVLLVLGLVLYGAVARSLEASGTAQLTGRADEITGQPGAPDEEVPTGGFIFGGRGSGTYAIIANAAGEALVGPGPGQDRIPEGLPLAAGIQAVRAGATRDIRTGTIGSDDLVPVRVLTDEVTFRGRVFYLQVVGDRTSEVRTLGVLVVVLVLGGVVALVVAIAAGAGYASRALVPIRRSLVAQRESLRRQREFAADASHELRTPLAVIRASVDDLERHRDAPVATVGTALDDIRAEVDQVTALVDDLLLLARSDSGALALERVPLDLGDVASSGASALATLATERGVAVTVDPEPADLLGDPTRLRQLVVILVDNAIRHAPSGGTVGVVVRRVGTHAVLTVDDDGPGISPEDGPRLFDRFYRAAGSPSGGTGLGLAIAAWIVDAHGGSIAATNRAEGGARFSVRLPLGGPT